MDKQEIELTKLVIDLSNRILEDKRKEREASVKKAFYQTIVSLAILFCLGGLFLYEIHESYSDVSITNTSQATIEERRIKDGES